MGFLGFKKKGGILDLTERYKKQQEKVSQMQNEESPSQNAFSFLGNLASGSNAESEDYLDVSGSEEKKKKFAKRLVEMTTKMEDLSNQIYHLQQRIEVLEKKIDVGRF
jgi:hypothetical protein